MKKYLKHKDIILAATEHDDWFQGVGTTIDKETGKLLLILDGIQYRLRSIDYSRPDETGICMVWEVERAK
jgi:hypothetical protein